MTASVKRGGEKTLSSLIKLSQSLLFLMFISCGLDDFRAGVLSWCSFPSQPWGNIWHFRSFLAPSPQEGLLESRVSNRHLAMLILAIFSLKYIMAACGNLKKRQSEKGNTHLGFYYMSNVYLSRHVSWWRVNSSSKWMFAGTWSMIMSIHIPPPHTTS